jgi:hypothetical protein
MGGLTYEQRKRAIFEFLYSKDGGLLRRYKTPDYLSDDALRDEVNMLVDDINQHIPSGLTQPDLHNLLPMINAAIRQRQSSQGWPLAKVFITATGDAVATLGRQKAVDVSANTASLNPVEITAKRMRAGESIGEWFLYGRQAIEMIESRQIDQTTLDGYRSRAFLNRKEQNGEGAASLWEIEARNRHQLAQEERGARESDDGPICRWAKA